MPFKHTIDLDFRQLHFLLWNAKGVPEPLFILLLSVAVYVSHHIIYFKTILEFITSFF